MKFRKDINSLRALAVIAVVLYHFFPDILPGGFIGVDIFFVISGYLMTGIIVRGIIEKNFNLVEFYSKRARRILPPLAALCTTLLILGWFILAPLEYLLLAKHVSSSLTFLSNHVYLSESGYFDSIPRDKWLLHTWSLSVEYQFYLLYPLFITAIHKTYLRTHIIPTLVFLCFILFTFSVFASFNWKDDSYYLLPMRAWEMLVGGVSFLISKELKKPTQRFFEYIGLALLLLSLVIIDSTVAWPGYMAILPVLGVTFVIIANRERSFFSNSKILNYIGKWSYSIYLWHWPIIAFLYYIYTPNTMTLLFGIILALILGFVSFTFIEKVNISYLSFVLPLTVSFTLMLTGGYAYQVPKSVYAASLINPKEEKYGGYTWGLHKQFEDAFSDSRPNLLLLGDSQAGDFANILKMVGAYSKYEIKSSIISAKCGSFYIHQSIREEYYNSSSDINSGKISKELCVRQWERFYQHDILVSADVIVISMNWRDYSNEFLSHSLLTLRKKNPKAKVVIVGPKSLSSSIPREMYRAARKGGDVNKYVYQKAANGRFAEIERFRKEVASLTGITYISLIDSICDDSEKTCTVVHDGYPFFYDSTHSTFEGNKYMAKYVKNVLVQYHIL